MAIVEQQVFSKNLYSSNKSPESHKTLAPIEDGRRNTTGRRIQEGINLLQPALHVACAPFRSQGSKMTLKYCPKEDGKYATGKVKGPE